MTTDSIADLIDRYQPDRPLARARTIPASWYVDPRILDLELRTTFANTWQYGCRLDQVREPGQFVTLELAGEPLLIVRGADGVLRGFFNVCRHHAAAVVAEPAGCLKRLQCPYHGWTYTLEGRLKAAPAFEGVEDFDPADHGLVPVSTAVWENWVFVRLASEGPSLEEFLGPEVVAEVGALGLANLHWFDRKHYVFDCNWKVFVDNYLDGGYHVPYLHAGLGSVLDYNKYTIENGRHHCLQSSPMVTRGAEAETGAVRKGDRACYYWFYPNFMVNWYQGVMDTNLVYPRGVDQTEVIFDFWFADVSESARAFNRASIDIANRVQDEDEGICRSVQRGLHSRAYDTGRLSVRREAGEQLFHQLLHAELKAGAMRG
ncbi:MAG: aromatic ring-hydroxylating dioxygenase subunit alpha [Lysobacterales bacterium]|nr:MAG: aromatic ring-hydroxylating dioxygenase subunit alpha [Xanthomonadales bacterium]